MGVEVFGFKVGGFPVLAVHGPVHGLFVALYGLEFRDGVYLCPAPAQKGLRGVALDVFGKFFFGHERRILTTEFRHDLFFRKSEKFFDSSSIRGWYLSALSLIPALPAPASPLPSRRQRSNLPPPPRHWNRTID